MGNQAWYHTVYAYELASDKSRAITDGLSDAIEPVFDAGGKYLYFLASTDAGPVNLWFSQAAEDMRMPLVIYLAVLRKGIALAAGPRKRRGKAAETDDKAESDGAVKWQTDGPGAVTIDFERIQQRIVGFAIDFAGIDQRIVALPSRPAATRICKPGGGQVFYRGLRPVDHGDGEVQRTP